ncbi:MAG: GGDEF domain-containing protein [Alphaproteobacteria bacterium]|nr:GGDEF domain-containing protein [Alphaproteobacteria bacterium]
MSFINEKERAQTQMISQQVLERIAREDLLPDPENYELWYVYYSRSLPEVVRVIDGIVESGQKINDYVCGEVYNRFLSDLRNEEAVRNAGEQVQNAIHNVSGMVEGVKHATKSYGSTLNEVGKRITVAQTPEDFRSILSVAGESTRQMMEQNIRLEEMLRESNIIMDELRRDLEHVRREALTDGLTGLANRKSFDSSIDQILKDTLDRKTTFCILMLDIDYFKAFNDNFGHQIGDQVLRLVARTLKDGLKGKDVAARYGGEEFAIILPDTEISGAVTVGNALRKAVAGKDVINRSTGKVLGRITLSVGAAEYAGEKTPEMLIARADEALYSAKHNGRNQVAAAPKKLS